MHDLARMEKLSTLLGYLRGRSLRPAEGLHERLHGCGPLAEAIEREPWCHALEAVTDARGALQVWASLAAHEPACRRLLALLFRGWGAQLATQERYEEAHHWLHLSLEWLREFTRNPQAIAQHLRQPIEEAQALELGREVLQLWLHEHEQFARASLPLRQWPVVWMHWSLLAQARGWPEAQVALESLTGAFLGHIERLTRAGAERGVDSAQEQARELLHQALAADPDNAALHHQHLALGERLAMRLWTSRQLRSFEAQAQALLPSLLWLDQHQDPAQLSPERHEQWARGWICAAAAQDHPARALAWLERAQQLYPEAPHLEGLLAQARLALSARRLGAGDHRRAAALLTQAWPTMEHPPEAARKLKVALEERLGPMHRWSTQEEA